MESLATYLDMGGHGGFIWPAYGVAALVLLAILVASLRGLRANQAALARLESEPETRDPASEGETA